MGFFGEFEFWFAIIKVVTIIALIVIGLVIILFGVGELGHASFSNLGTRRFFPYGLDGVRLCRRSWRSPSSAWSWSVTAGEAQNPETVLPSAINAVVWRILIFYIGALVVIMSLVPWNQLDPTQSPFVMVFDRIGIPAAGGSSTSS